MLNFPSSPGVGQIYDKYQWDGTTWLDVQRVEWALYDMSGLSYLDLIVPADAYGLSVVGHVMTQSTGGTMTATMLASWDGSAWAGAADSYLLAAWGNIAADAGGQWPKWYQTIGYMPLTQGSIGGSARGCFFEFAGWLSPFCIDSLGFSWEPAAGQRMTTFAANHRGYAGAGARAQKFRISLNYPVAAAPSGAFICVEWWR